MICLPYRPALLHGRRQRRLDTITCAQKVGVSPHIQHCTKCKSRFIALKTVLKVTVSWNPWEKKIQRHIPPVHPSYFLQIEKTHFSKWRQQKQYLSIAVGFFRCYNIRSTRFTSVLALDLAIVHKCKHFSYQLSYTRKWHSFERVVA